MGHVPYVVSFSDAFKDKFCFADPELQQKLEKELKCEDDIAPPAAASIPSLTSHPLPTVQPIWVEKKDKSESIESMLEDKKLKIYHPYGTCALDIYRNGCKALTWREGLDKHFDQHTVLYARNVTPGKYSLWFLVHHSWIKKKEESSERWWNTIGRDIVHEDWIENRLTDEDRQNLKYDDSTRLTFAKGKNGKYFYIGLFKPLGIIWNRIDGPKGWGVYHTKIYKRIG